MIDFKKYVEQEKLDNVEMLKIAYEVALGSPDPSTQNGAVLASKVPGYGWRFATACNIFPPGVACTQDRLERPKKYAYIEHAERGVIYNAAREGIRTDGAIMFVPWWACDSCGRAVIQSGVKKIVGHKRMFDATPARWKDSISDAMVMLNEAGVEMELIEERLGVTPIRFNGELWEP